MTPEEILQQQAEIARAARTQNKSYPLAFPDAYVAGYDADLGQDIIQLSDGSIRYAQSDTNGSLGLGDSILFHEGMGTAHIDDLPHIKRQPIINKPKVLTTYPFKILFSVVEDGVRKFYVGGDRSIPKLILEISFTDYYLYGGLTNLGKKDFIAALEIYDTENGDYPTRYRITPTRKEEYQILEIGNVQYYAGSGYWVNYIDRIVNETKVFSGVNEVFPEFNKPYIFSNDLNSYSETLLVGTNQENSIITTTNHNSFRQINQRFYLVNQNGNEIEINNSPPVFFTLAPNQSRSWLVNNTYTLIQGIDFSEDIPEIGSYATRLLYYYQSSSSENTRGVNISSQTGWFSYDENAINPFFFSLSGSEIILSVQTPTDENPFNTHQYRGIIQSFELQAGRKTLTIRLTAETQTVFDPFSSIGGTIYSLQGSIYELPGMVLNSYGFMDAREWNLIGEYLYYTPLTPSTGTVIQSDYKHPVAIYKLVLGEDNKLKIIAQKAKRETIKSLRRPDDDTIELLFISYYPPK